MRSFHPQTINCSSIICHGVVCPCWKPAIVSGRRRQRTIQLRSGSGVTADIRAHDHGRLRAKVHFSEGIAAR
jgi:hypothetical protein